MKRLLLIFVILCILSPSLSAQKEVIYFYEEGCPQCERVSLILNELSQEHSLHIIMYDVATQEGYTLFKRYGFATTPALLINGKKLEGKIEKSDILRALKGYRWYYFLIALVLGFLSGVSPTLMGVHTDIIDEVGRTTREETEVIFRSLLFYSGILVTAFCLFLVLDVVLSFPFVAVLLGIVVSLNLLNSGLHSFNSYTRIDLYIKTKFITLGPFSVLKLGLLHGIAKFSDSVPMFLPLMYIIITEGAFIQDLGLFLLLCTGIILSYAVILLLAIVQINLFKKFKNERISQVYFCVSGLSVMAVSLLLLWEILEEAHILTALILTVLVTVVSGVLMGFRRRVVY